MDIIELSVPYLLLGDVLSPNAGIGDEESLVGCESEFLSVVISPCLLGLCLLFSLSHSLYLCFLSLLCVLECVVCHLKSAMVSEILSECHASVGHKSWQELYVREEVSEEVSEFLEVLHVLFLPPAGHVAVLVVM